MVEIPMIFGGGDAVHPCMLEHNPSST